MDYAAQTQHDFQTFFQNWMTRLEHYFDQLLHLINIQSSSSHPPPAAAAAADDQQQLIRQVLTHYHEYSLAKTQLISRRNVFLVLSSPWFSSYERAFLWLSGFKPSLVIYVVKSCGVELSPDQTERMERLTAETKEDEKQITERLSRLLEQQVLAPSMLELATIITNRPQQLLENADTAVGRLAEDMEFLVGCADHLREKTVSKVVGILATPQTVRFLAAMAQLQLKIRRWGKLRDDA